ncbi:tRNA lysidine(34) synthetase TilS [Maritalea sp.]|uniref:tRNA lysidine(34) synthetase TilS n=1 Tax=Maritalea sp. TaxID=2003361 RepID=UPI003EF16919
MLKGALADLSLDDPDRLNLLFAPMGDVDHFALAVSGGVDSLALMVLAAKWRTQQSSPVEITVFTVDHGLRPEAKQETQFVANTARALGLEVQILTGTIEAPESGLQVKARALRYGLIGEAMDRLGISTLLTGHHLDDQTETVLMRLARGSGVTGLGGMSRQSVRDDMFLFRPFLDVTREQLERVVARQEYLPVNDPSNESRDFERVRWRQFMPQLHDAGLTNDMVGLSAQRLRRADDALRQWAEQEYEEAFAIDPFGCVYFDIKALMKQPVELGVRLLARALDDAGGVSQTASLAQLEALHDHFTSGHYAFKGLTLGGCGIKVNQNIGQIFREAGRLQGKPIMLDAGQSAKWDNRFQIIVAPDVRSPIRVSPATEITRNLLENMLPDLPFVPIEAVRAAPMVSSPEQIMAIGEHILAEGVDVFRTFGPNALN